MSMTLPEVIPEPRISNFSIGGETNNVMLIAANGARNIYFGKGMDNVEIRGSRDQHT